MKIKVMGDAVRFTSGIKASEWELLRKFGKKVCLKDKEGNETFLVSVKPETEISITKFGITYNTVDENADEVYTTAVYPNKTEADIKDEMINSTFAGTIANIYKAECEAQEVLNEIKTLQEDVEDIIE